MPERLVLWDVDGTLLTTGGMHGKTTSQAILRALGQELPSHNISFSGRTDPEILRLLLQHAGAENIDALLPVALKHLEELIAAEQSRIRIEGHVMPGVVDALRAFDADHRIAQTVLTGNLLATARVKLEAFGLDEWLDPAHGATGSDHEDRRNLVPIAIARASAHFGYDFSPDETWVIGDARGDFDCAAAAGARCLLVRTSLRPGHTHEGCEPEAFMDDLSDTAALVSLILSARVPRRPPGVEPPPGFLLA